MLHVRDVTFRKEMEERIQRDQRQLADAQRVARMGSWEEDLRTESVTWSEGLFRLYGLDPRTTRPSRAAWLSTMHPDERDKVLGMTEQAERDGNSFNVRRRVVRPDGTELLALCHAEVDLDEGGTSCRIRGTVLDISAQVELERRLDTERRFLRAVLDNLEDGVVACEANGALSLFNPATERLHGATFRSIPAGETPATYHLFAADGVTPLAPDEVPLTRALHHGHVSHEEIVIAPPDRPARLVTCSGQAIIGEDGRRLGAVVTMHDITAQRRNEDALRQLADHDVLTGLPNRTVFSDRHGGGPHQGDRERPRHPGTPGRR